MKVMLEDGAFMPVRAHKTDAGLDIMSPIDIVVPPTDADRQEIGSAIINSGVHVELPPNTVGMLKSKSGLNIMHGITSEGTVDEGYTGAIKVKLYNFTSSPYRVRRGDKISQLVVLPCQYVDVELVNELAATERGDKGFGSTGK